MVCVYCGGRTKVVNSRPQRRSNSIWRRRACATCRAVFTTEESANLSGSVMVEKQGGGLQPLLREKLVISLATALKHHPEPITTASELANTILGKLLLGSRSASVTSTDIIHTSEETLRRFDYSAYLRYVAEYSTGSVKSLRRIKPSQSDGQ